MIRFKKHGLKLICAQASKRVPNRKHTWKIQMMVVIVIWYQARVNETRFKCYATKFGNLNNPFWGYTKGNKFLIELPLINYLSSK
jgi:hypothetical protein